MTQLHLYLAKVAYDHAAANYNTKDARFDVIVECMDVAEIAEQLHGDGVSTEAEAIDWANGYAGLQHEVELNQAWDGPESCIGSSRYVGSDIDYPTYTLTPDELVELEARDLYAHDPAGDPTRYEGNA